MASVSSGLEGTDCGCCIDYLHLVLLIDNLVQAFSLAVHPSSRNRGVMLLFSDRISPAYYALKTSSSRLDTFKCFEAGHLGLMNNLTPHYFYEPAKATNKPFFDISKLEDLPKVALLTCYIDQDLDDLDRKAADKDVKGIVLAGVGTVSLFSALIDAFSISGVHLLLRTFCG